MVFFHNKPLHLVETDSVRPIDCSVSRSMGLFHNQTFALTEDDRPVLEVFVRPHNLLSLGHPTLYPYPG